MEIKEGEYYKCIKTVIMDDGEIAYIKGKNYLSNRDFGIIDEQDDNHTWRNEPYEEYFELGDGVDDEVVLWEIRTESVGMTSTEFIVCQNGGHDEFNYVNDKARAESVCDALNKGIIV